MEGMYTYGPIEGCVTIECKGTMEGMYSYGRVYRKRSDMCIYCVSMYRYTSLP